MKEKKDRVEDALHATKAALEEGILPGGGIALLNASKMLVEELNLPTAMPQDQAVGFDIVIQAIEKPFYRILQNAGLENEYIGNLEQSIIESGDSWEGFNPRSSKIVNMFSEGIIDPTKVTRLALENAASVAGTMLLTEAVVSNIKEDKAQAEVDPAMFM